MVGWPNDEQLKQTPTSAAIEPAIRGGATRSLSKWWSARKPSLAEVESDWHDFPNLPGRHLSWRKAGRACWELITDSNGAVSVRCEYKIFRPRLNAYTSQGRTYAWQQVVKRKFLPAARVADLVNTATKAPVLRITGVHFGGHAGTSVSLAGQREIRFPVRGGQKKCALMSAIDDLGNSLVEYRTVRVTNSWAIDAVINPNALTFPQIELLVAVSAPLLFGYFQKPNPSGV
jgi:hypothetical protein